LSELTWRRAIVPTCIAVALSCAPHRIPSALRGYDILVERGDEQSNELARALREGGFRVRRAVKGGSGPTAALVYFTFTQPETEGPTWLHLRLADTRSGIIVRAATIVLDSVSQTPRGRAQAAVGALMAPDTISPSP
jgi:hypothetical protein